MNPDLTINPVLIARTLAGTRGSTRALELSYLITAFTAAVVVCGHDTVKVLNGSASIMWLHTQRDLVWQGGV